MDLTKNCRSTILKSNSLIMLKLQAIPKANLPKNGFFLELMLSVVISLYFPFLILSIFHSHGKFFLFLGHCNQKFVNFIKLFKKYNITCIDIIIFSIFNLINFFSILQNFFFLFLLGLICFTLLYNFLKMKNQIIDLRHFFFPNINILYYKIPRKHYFSCIPHILMC